MPDCFKLYNLDLGKEPLDEPFIVGPFCVSPVQDYPKAIKSLYNEEIISEESKETKWKNFSIRNTKSVLNDTEWIHTANAVLTKKHHKSILSIPEEDDDEVWDLCEVLTFITGRRVTTKEHLPRWNPSVFHSENQIAYSDLPTLASQVYSEREKLSDLKLALIYYNEALSYRTLQINTLLIFAALENIINHSNYKDVSIDEVSIKILKSSVEESVKSLELDEEIRKRWLERLKFEIGKGLTSQNTRLSKLVFEFFNPQTSGTNDENVKFIISIRNDVVHGRSIEDTKKKRAVCVVYHIVPVLIRLKLLKTLQIIQPAHLRQFDIHLLQSYLNSPSGLCSHCPQDH